MYINKCWKIIHSILEKVSQKSRYMTVGKLQEWHQIRVHYKAHGSAWKWTYAFNDMEEKMSSKPRMLESLHHAVQTPACKHMIQTNNTNKAIRYSTEENKLSK